MESAARTSSGLRIRPRLWAFCFVFGTPLYYFFIRETCTPKNVTLGEQAFIVGYSLLISGSFAFGTTRMILGLDRSRWLDAPWKRFAAYFVAALALTGLAAVLPLPAFYANILQHTIIFLVLPIFLSGRGWTARNRWFERASISSQRAASLVGDGDHDLVLRMPRRKALFLFGASSLFVAIGWWMHLQAPVVGWTCIVFFGLGIPISLLMLIPGFSQLALRSNGFTMRHSWRRLDLRWDEISDLTVVSGTQGARVAFNVTKPSVRRSAMLREMYGRDLLLSDNYGLSASDLCALMQARQAAASRLAA
jgi:hypothetical protein